MTTISDLEKEEAARILGRRKIPAFQPGDTVRVNVRIKEGERVVLQGVHTVTAGEKVRAIAPLHPEDFAS